MSRTIRNVSWVTMAGMIGYLLGIVRGFIVPRALGPEDYGLWGAFNLILLYGFNLHGGISHAMNREVAVARGAGEMERASEIRATAFTWIAGLVSVVTGLTLLGVGGFALGGGDRRIAICLALVVLALPLQQLDVYTLTVLRTEHRFTWIALSRTLVASVSLLLLILLLPSLGIYALPLAVITGFGLGGGLLYTRLAERPHVRWAPRDAGALLRIGFPLLLITLVFALFRSADRFVILRYLDLEHLGYYGVASVFLELVYMLPESVGAVLNPQFNEGYGRAKSAGALRGLLSGSISTLSLVLAPATALIFVTLEYPIRLLLPAYTPAIVPAQVLVIGAYFWGTARVTEFFFIAINRPLYSLVLQASAVVLNLTLSVGLVLMGYGLVGIATGTAVAYTAYGVVAVFVALRLTELRVAQAAHRTLTAFLPLVPALVGIALVRLYVTPTADAALNWHLLAAASTRCGIVLLTCLPVLWLLFRRVREARA